MDNHKIRPPLIGGSSLLVVFAVLCLTVFALLGFSTVLADKRLSDASASAVANYYDADLQAEMILAQLRNGDVPEGVEEENGIYSYACPVSDTQELQVAVCIEGTTWKILRWKTVSTAVWGEEAPLPVWDGKK